MTANRNAVIYARVSSTQQKTQGHGLESQAHRCREYAQYKGLTVVEVFQDDMSGAYTGRPGMMAMLAYLKKHRSDPHVVIIDDISRLARGLEAHLQLRTAISNASGILQSPSIEFGEDSDSVLVENLLASVSQHQRQKNGEQTKNRMRARAGAGYYCLKAPVGYRFERVTGHGKMLVRNEPAASVVTEALEGYASGRFQAQAEVTRFLQQHPGYPAHLRTSMTRERVNEMLTRVTYAGLISIPDWDLHLVPGKHEGLIDYTTFQQIAERMAGRANVPARKDLNVDFPLRSFITCGDCDAPLSACWSTSRNGTRHPYYLCQHSGCASYGKSIRRDVVEGEFADLLQAMKPSADLFALAHHMFRDLWNGKIASARHSALTLEAEMTKIEKSVGQLLDRVVDADSPTLVSAYEKRIKALEQDKASLRDRIATCGRPAGDFDAMFRTAFDFLGNPYKLWVSERFEDKRAVLKLAFADRLAYVRGEGFRTAQLTAPFGFFSEITSNQQMVPLTGLEPVTPALRRLLKQRNSGISLNGLRAVLLMLGLVTQPLPSFE